MRKMLSILAALVLAASFGSAQSVLSGLSTVPIMPASNAITAVDTTPAMVVKYFPGANTTASTSATSVAVEASGDLTFVVNGVAYAGFELPVSGALGGVIDVSDASADTFGEVCDAINSTPVTFATGYFRCALVGVLRSDSSNDTLVADAADTEVTRPIGDLLYIDSSEANVDTVTLFDADLGWQAVGTKKGISGNPNDNKVTFVQYFGETITNAGTIGAVSCYGITENYQTGGGCNAAGDCGSGSEKVRTIYSEAAAASTVLNSSLAEFPNGFYAKDEKVMCRIPGDGTDTSAIKAVLSGFTYPIVQR